jgi:hypothetical protein
MIKATLKYTVDGRNVFKVLTRNKVIVIKTIPAALWNIETKVVILCKDYAELQNVLYQLNDHCSYEVSLVKYKYIKKYKNIKENNL